MRKFLIFMFVYLCQLGLFAFQFLSSDYSKMMSFLKEYNVVIPFFSFAILFVPTVIVLMAMVFSWVVVLISKFFVKGFKEIRNGDLVFDFLAFYPFQAGINYLIIFLLPHHRHLLSFVWEIISSIGIILLVKRKYQQKRN